MAGKHGTLRQYFRAYRRYGGTPPIPGWSDHGRGEKRAKWVWRALAAFALTVALAPVLMASSALPKHAFESVAVLGSLALMWVATAHLLAFHIGQPVADWLEDIPRRGLPEVDIEYATSSGRAAEVSD